MPIAVPPALRRALISAEEISLEFVPVRSMIMTVLSGVWGPSPRSWSRTPPGTAVAGEHVVSGLRAPAAGRVLLGLALRGPVVDHRVEDLPAELHLGVLREQRRIAEQHVEDQPLVRLRRGLGERAAVREVHVDVADLHRRTGDLGTEPHRDALVGLDPQD